MIYEKYLEDIEFKKIDVPFDKIDETIKIYQTLYFLIGMEFLAETSQNDKLHYNYLLGNIIEDKKIFLKALSKDIFRDYLSQNKISASPKLIEDFYKMTRGYYYYTMLSIKIIQAMKLDLNEFLQKFNQSGLSFDSYLGLTYVNLVPTSIRNFFWFLRTVRHGLSLNALAVFDLYDEFSIEYLKTNLMIFQSDDILYVQDYFLQKIDISIPAKTEVKLHKYIINIYEGQLKSQVKDRAIFISRQAMRAEIEYHNECINGLNNKKEEL